MITGQEKNAIKRILQDPAWTVIQHCADLLIDNIQETSVVKDNEWETLKATVEREAMITGIRKFILDLYNNAQ